VPLLRAGIRGALVAAFAFAVAAIGFCEGGLAQGAQPAADNPALQVGLCQCVADRTTRNLFCAAGASKCQQTCASPLYAFLPLGQGAVDRCAPSEVYVVLPNADGEPGSGAIKVTQGTDSTLLDKPYAAAAALNGATAHVGFDQKKVDHEFGDAIGARPILPKHFRLFFQSGGDSMAPESAAEFQAVLADIKRRPIYEVELVGHADTLSGDAENQKLSLARAESVRQSLIKAGVAPGTITTAGRGESELLVPTAKNTAEPKNRRVEVTVR
jgi:peptidoglycan-associated lipoprotein